VEGIVALHAQWRKLLDEAPGSEDFTSTAATITQRIKDVEWDLQDLGETVVVVEKNRARFRIDDAELASRKLFLQKTRETLQRIQHELVSPETKGRAAANARAVRFSALCRARHSHSPLPPLPPLQLLLKKREGGQGSRYAKLDEVIAQENARFIEGQEQMQAQIMREQDAELEVLGQSVRKLGDMGRQIGDEIQLQGQMIEELSDNVDRTTTRIDAAKRKINTLINQSKDKCMTALIIILILTLVGIVLAASLIKFK